MSNLPACHLFGCRYALDGDASVGKQGDIERPPPKEEDAEIPCGLDPHYVAFMREHDKRQADYYDLLGVPNMDPSPIAGLPRRDAAVKLAPLEAVERDMAAPAMADKAAGLTAGFSDFFGGGVVATPNPAKFDIRSRHEIDIAIERNLERELGGVDMGTMQALRRRAEKEKAGWNKRINMQQQQRKLEREAAGGAYSGAQQGLSVTAVLANSKTAGLEKRREGRLRLKEDRQASKRSEHGTWQYEDRQRQIADDKVAAARYKTNQPLHLAAKAGELDTLQILVHKGNVDLLGEYGQTALMLAAQARQVAAVEALLKVTTAPTKEMACRQIKTGLTISLVPLLQVPAQRDLQDDDGMTALMWAAANGAVDCVRMLMKWGAILSVTDNEGNAAVDWAFSADPAQVVRQGGTQRDDATALSALLTCHLFGPALHSSRPRGPPGTRRTLTGPHASRGTRRVTGASGTGSRCWWSGTGTVFAGACRTTRSSRAQATTSTGSRPTRSGCARGAGRPTRGSRRPRQPSWRPRWPSRAGSGGATG